jgi:hypothetical protein
MNLPTDPQFLDSLDAFENSMKQWVPPEIDLPADQLCRQLDALEASIENQNPLGSPLSDPFYGVLDNMGKSVEQQDSLEPGSGQVLPTEGLANSGAGRFGLQGQVGGPEAEKPIQNSEETSAVRQRSKRIPKIRGRGGSGVRNSSGESGHYCFHREVWVKEEECESCPDFEEDENAAKDEDEKRCKRSNFRLSKDSDE